MDDLRPLDRDARLFPIRICTTAGWRDTYESDPPLATNFSYHKAI